MTSPAYAILTDSELDTWLPELQNQTTSPEKDTLNDIATLKLEDMCGGTAFVQRSFSEDHPGGLLARRGGIKRLRLNRTPIVSVTSITDDDGNTIDATDYTIVGTLGNSYLDFDGVMPAPVGRWTVIYTAGVFASSSAVANDVKLAAANMIRRLRENKGVSVQSSSVSGRAGSKSRTRANPRTLPTLAELGMPVKYIRRMV